MNNITRWLKVIPLFLLMLTGIYFIPVNAYVQATYNGNLWDVQSLVAGSSFRKGNPAYNRVVINAGTGKYVVVDIDDSDSDQIHIYTFSSTGTLLANTDTGFTLAGAVVACDFDADEILVAYTTTTGNTVKWFRYNVVSYAVGTEYTSTVSGMSGATMIPNLSNIIYNPTTTRYYILVGCYGYSGGSGQSILYFTGSAAGQTLKTTGLGAYGGTNQVMHGFLDLTGQDIYYYYSIGGTFQLVDFDITGGTLTSIASAPFAGGCPTTDEITNGYHSYYNFYDVSMFTSGSNVYVTGSWSISHRTGTWGGSPPNGVRYVDTYFWYIKFNSVISSGTILANNWITDQRSDLSGSLSTTLGFSCGYQFHVGSSPTYNVNTYYQNIGSGKYVNRATYTITDITTDPTDFSTESILTGCDDLDFDYIAYDASVSMDAVYGWSLSSVSKTNCKFVIGGPVLAKVYSATHSVAPVDSPMVTSKVYAFTWTIYVNGVVDTYNETYKLYIDGVERGSGTIPATGPNAGEFTNSFSFSSVKTYDMQVLVYNLGVLQYTTTLYSFDISTATGGGGTTPPVLIPNYAFLLTGYAPIAFIVLGPILMLGMLGAKMGGAGAMVGMLMGAIVGVIAGVNTSILPTYTIYLIAMAVVLGLVVFMKMGGGGGGGGGE